MIIEAQLKELETLHQEAEVRLEPVEQRLTKGLSEIEDIDTIEFLRIQPLSAQLRNLLSPPKDYSIKGMIAPAMPLVKLFWQSDLFFMKPVLVLLGCSAAFGVIDTGARLLQAAPVTTIGGILLAGIGWKLLVGALKKGDEVRWRQLVRNEVSTCTYLAAVRQTEDWYVVYKEMGRAADLTAIGFRVPDICEGFSMIDVFAGPNRQFAGVVGSNDRFYPPGQFDYPVAITVPDAVRSLFSKMQAMHGLVKELWQIKIELQDIGEKHNELATLNDVWKDVHIPEAVKGRLLQMLGLFSAAGPAAPRGLLLFGPPGTGKTLIAKAIADSCGAAFFASSLPDFKMGNVGGSTQKVKKFWNEVREHGRAIIFIDECEGVFGSRGGVDSDSFTAEIVQTFLAEWDGLNTKGKAPDIWVIGATNRRELIDVAILSRFGQEIEIPLPDGAMRRNILEAELEAINLSTEWLPENTDKLTQGLSGRDINRLATATRMAMLGEDSPTPEHLKAALAQMRKRGATASDEEARWDTLVLDGRTMKELKTVCGMLNHADALRKQGVAIPRGIIFHGPPGTGKTQIARTLANESGLNFIAATTSDVKANYLGQSGNKVKELFARVRSQSPAILFIDEIDIICPVRGSTMDAFAQEIIGQILQELDGVKAIAEHVFIVAATNRLDSIDSAVLSRFPKQVEIPLPDLAARKQLIAIMLRKLSHTLTEADFLRMAEASEGRSGRDLRSMVENAQNNAVARALEGGNPTTVKLTPEDFE